jgi:hypothetical protein
MIVVMKYRKLRVAWSVTCGVLCLLLIALWVRSYSWFDQILGPISANTWFCVQSLDGRLMFEFLDDGQIPAEIDLKWSWIEIGTGGRGQGVIYRLSDGELSLTHVVIPIWAALSALASVGCVTALPWLHWRFSVRTLFIGMTVVAVVLGLIIAITSIGS